MSRFELLLQEFFYRPDEDPGPFFVGQPEPEELPAPLEEEPPAEFLGFRLEREQYAIPLPDVREIVKVPPLTEVPRAPASLLGVMSLRGEVLPVYDVRPKLHLSDRVPKLAGPPEECEPLPRGARVLLVRTAEGDAGVLVDEVAGVVRLKPSTLELPPPGVAGPDRDSVVGLGRKGEHLYILLDLERALT